MRLTCPTCGAEYDPPAGTIPADGRHVQCTACHTRWFVRGRERPVLSEDQILKRLEARKPGPHLRPVPDAGPPDAAAPDAPAEPQDEGDFLWEGPEGQPQATAEEGDAAKDGDAPALRPVDWPSPPLAGVPQPQRMPEAPVEPQPDSVVASEREAGTPLRPKPGAAPSDAGPSVEDGQPTEERPPSRHWALVLVALAILGGIAYLMIAPAVLG